MRDKTDGEPIGSFRLRRRELLKTFGAALGAAVLPSALPGCGDRAVTSTPAFLSDAEQETLAALCDRIFPPDHEPGARALGAAVYVERLLAAFDGPGTPAIYGGGPFSGRYPFAAPNGTPSDDFPRNRFARFLPLSRMQELRWRAEIFGTAATPGADTNDAVLGPMRGLRDVYRDGLAALEQASVAQTGAGFAVLSPDEQDTVLDAFEPTLQPEPRREGTFMDIVIRHTMEACFAPPEYGGNRDGQGWAITGLAGDVQPLGFSLYVPAQDGYVERPDAPMSTANPDELAPDGTLQPRPLNPDAARVQENILRLAHLSSSERDV